MAFLSGKIGTIPLYIEETWFLLIAIMTVNLGLNAIPNFYPNWDPSLIILTSLTTSLLISASIVFHELAHAVVAKAHSLTVKAVHLFLLGGILHIEQEAPDPTTEFRITIAGPFINALIAIACIELSQASPINPWALIFLWVGQANIAIALFNLIPGFPLDGGRLLRATMWGIWRDKEKATRWLIHVSVALGLSLMVLGGSILIGAEYPLIENSILNAVWLIIMGWFLQDAANQIIWSKDTTSVSVA